MESPNNTTKYPVASIYYGSLFRWRKIFTFLLCLVVVVLLSTYTQQIRKFKTYNFGWFRSVWEQKEELFQPTCVNVLDRAVVGHWVERNVTYHDVEELSNFYKVIRNRQGIGWTLQRADGRCGNLAIDGAGGKVLTPFRALCEPNGTTPCCFEYKCVSKPVERCRCEHCYDLRQQIHAELYTWIPADPTCKILEFKGKHDTCRLLRNVTIYFIGDSFMRQLYTSVISLVRDNYFDKNATEEERQMCSKHFIMLSACKSSISLDAHDCGNKTRLKLITHWRTDQNNKTMEYMAELQGRPNTFVVFGTGVHQGFNLNVVENQILNPILSLLSKSPWPVPIWMSTHSVGLLKPPVYKSQQTEYVVKYNHRINDILRRNRIPFMDFYQMTNNVMSYDGTHYGSGINDLKAQILLNKILEVRINENNL